MSHLMHTENGQAQDEISKSLLEYTLQLADDALVMGHRLGEWCGHGPILEQDIALTNTSLDHIGRARSLYQYAAELLNQSDAGSKTSFFSSVALGNKISAETQLTEDDLAYLRDCWDYRNLLLVEQPNNDWAYTVVRSFFYDLFNFYLYAGLEKNGDKMLASIAEKSLKEITYHLRWSSEWVIRLGDGTDDSHRRVQKAIEELWMFTGELFMPCLADQMVHDLGLGIDLETIRQPWNEHVSQVLQEATLQQPSGTWMQHGGREGRHTEHLGYLLAELQFMQRTYPDMAW